MLVRLNLAFASIIALLSAVPARATEKRPSLTAAYGERLEQILPSRESWRPFPAASDRKFWESLPPALRQRLIAAGEAEIQKKWEPVAATAFLEFYRSGSKEPYQRASFARRDRLGRLVLAECAEANGRFLDEIVNGVWAIAEESFWGNAPSTWVQADIDDQRRFGGSQLAKIRTNLPDITRPGVDLWVGETAGQLAMTDYLLGPELDRISPMIRKRISLEMERRMLTPLLDRDFSWMGGSGNWNPWITSNWLAAVLLMESDTDRRLAAVRRIFKSLDGYLAKYPSDGGCDEGPGYWRRSAGSLFDSLELLHSASNGSIQIFHSPLVKNIGAYIYRAHIAGDYFTNYADAHARLSMPAELMIRYGRRVDDAHLMALGGSLASEDASGGGSLLRSVPAIVEVARGGVKRAGPPLIRDVWLPDIQVMAARSKGGTTDGLYLSAKAGHNGEGHNHNDVGNFLMYLDGRPVIIDVGPEAYTAKNSSPERYGIWTMQSAYHNLPAIGPVMQHSGRRFAARDVQYRADDASAGLSMELAGTYPPEAGLTSWHRTVRLNRGSHVQLNDRYALAKGVEDLTLSLMTRCNVRELSAGVLELRAADLRTPFRVAFDGKKYRVKLEEIALEDGGLRRDWGEKLTRILLVETKPPFQGQWDVRFEPVR
jgi:hypothetical protein